MNVMRNSRLGLIVIAGAACASITWIGLTKIGAPPVPNAYAAQESRMNDVQSSLLKNDNGRHDIITASIHVKDSFDDSTDGMFIEHRSSPTTEGSTEGSADISPPTAPALISDSQSDYRAVPSLRHHLPLTAHKILSLTPAQQQEVQCLAWNVYFEIRGGAKDEQVAVAYVPVNRLGKSAFGNHICANVFQYGWAGGRKQYQFSWAGVVRGPRWKREDETWERVQNIALAVYTRSVPDTGRGATYFHCAQLASWAPNSKKIRIGSHVFWNM